MKTKNNFFLTKKETKLYNQLNKMFKIRTKDKDKEIKDLKKRIKKKSKEVIHLKEIIRLKFGKIDKRILILEQQLQEKNYVK